MKYLLIKERKKNVSLNDKGGGGEGGQCLFEMTPTKSSFYIDALPYMKVILIKQGFLFNFSTFCIFSFLLLYNFYFDPPQFISLLGQFITNNFIGSFSNTNYSKMNIFRRLLKNGFSLIDLYIKNK